MISHAPKAFSVWFRAARLVAAPASLGPVAVGGLLPRAMGLPISWPDWWTALAAALLLHTAANLWNDYFDFTSGLDRLGGSMGSGVLPRGELTPRQVLAAALGCTLLSGVLGLWLAWRVAGWRLLALGGGGVLAAAAYAAGPWSPKRRGTGELWVLLWMGPAMTEGAFLVQTGHFSMAAGGVGVLLGILSALLMFLANARDLQTDQAVGLHTLAYWASTLGKPQKKPLACVTCLFLGALYGLLGLFMGHFLSSAAKWAFLTLPVAVSIVLRAFRGQFDAKTVELSALLHLLFALFLAIALLGAP